MDQFLGHKKTKILLIGFGLLLLGYLGLRLGLLPEDNPDTEVNETMQALMFYIGAVVSLTGTAIGAQGYADGKSGGATATKIGPAILLMCMLGLAPGCAAPDGVLEAHQDMGKIFVSLANQHAALVDALAVPDADKHSLMMEAKIDMDGFERVHSAMGAYLDSTDVFDQKQATEWISIIEKTRAALAGGEGDGG